MKTAARSRRDRIRAQLADLKMPGALEAIDDVLTGVDGGGVTASEAIEQLLGAQITLRNNRRLQAAMRSSRLPAIKTLEDFDFSFQPSIKREQIDSLHELGFLARKENVIFLGPPGVGKTHLAISLAIAAAQSGRRVYYGALADLITSLEEAKTAGQLGRRLKILTYPALLLIDEIGYLPVSQTGAMLFFQLINRRYERASTVLTSNKGFEEWGRLFIDMQWALIDQIVPMIKTLDRRVEHMGRDIPAVALLETVPGIGPYRALLIATETLPITRFRTPGHLVSYAGLAPRSSQSGLRPIRHGSIPAGANRWLRGTFVRAVVSHVAHAPDSWLSQSYELIRQRLGWQVARVATARRLARAVHAMLRTGEVWHDEPVARAN